MHFESPAGPPYRLNVADIANCMGKTTCQITPTLKSLLENGLISLPGVDESDITLPPSRLVLPTPQALQSHPAFAEKTAVQLQTELDTLIADYT
jgi:hypothetical protein